MKKLPAIILSAALLSLGAAFSPNIAQAFDATQPAGAATTSQTTGTNGAPHRPAHGWGALNLSAAQKAQLKSIHTATRSQISAVLTPDQQTQLNAALAANPNTPGGAKPHHHGNRFMRALHSLTLSPAQHQQIRAIQKGQHAQMLAVLTPDQQSQLKSMMGHRRRAGAQ